MKRTIYCLFWKVQVLTAMTCLLTLAPVDGAQLMAQPLSLAEHFVVREVAAGKTADLAHMQHKEISGRFLETFLADPKKYLKTMPRSVRIKSAVISGPVDLTNADIAYEMVLAHCTFMDNLILTDGRFRQGLKLGDSTFRDITIERATVDGTLDIQGATFEGKASFLYAKLQGSLEGKKAQFQNPDAVVSLNGAKISENMVLEEATFRGAVDFTGATISGDLMANGVAFLNEEKLVTFNDLTLTGSAFLNAGVFAGPVDFRNMQITRSFELEEAKFLSKRDPKRFTNPLPGNPMHAPIVYNVDFRRTQVGGTLWLVKANFHSRIRLEGLTYQDINMGPLEEFAWKRLFEKSVYSVDIYSRLEEYLRKQGYTEEANEVFIEGKSRQRQERLHGLTWLWSWMLALLVGYGRHPEYAAYWSVIPLVAGYLTFRNEKGMHLVDPDAPPSRYSPFWYSIDMFLPLTRLQAAEVWIPKRERRWAWLYMRVHVILGWILVPIGLAALMGIIK